MRGALCLVAIGLAALAGCGADDDSAAQLLDFGAPVGTELTEVLRAGELTIDAGCTGAASGPVLAVGASTTAEDATIASVYRQKGAGPGGYRFVNDEFGRDYGAWDFLGAGNEEVTGTLEYSSPGTHVSVSYFADQDEVAGECFLSGTAITAEG